MPTSLRRNATGSYHSCESEKSSLRVGEKRADLSVVVAKHALDDHRGAVSASDPDHLGWVTVQEAALMKVSIFGDDRQRILLGVLPHCYVIGAGEPDIADVQ